MNRITSAGSRLSGAISKKMSYAVSMVSSIEISSAIRLRSVHEFAFSSIDNDTIARCNVLWNLNH
ncbi:Uncharacterised protein [Vibrio cholerae]|nr:Uncharacterised protein [Vibrio cholerae]